MQPLQLLQLQWLRLKSGKGPSTEGITGHCGLNEANPTNRHLGDLQGEWQEEGAKV